MRLNKIRVKNNLRQVKNQGFTLVESLIALLIISITLGGLIGSYGQNTRYLAYAKEKALSQLLVNNLLIDIQSYPLTIGRNNDNVKFGYQTWYTQLHVTDFKFFAKDILQGELKIFASKADKDKNLAIQIQKFYAHK